MLNSKLPVGRSSRAGIARASLTIIAAAVAILLGAAGFAQEAAPAAAAAAPAQEQVIHTKNMLTVLWDGGPLMLPIAICSFVLFVFVFERFVSLRRGRVIPGPFVKRFLQQLRDGQLDRDKAIKLCDENKSPVAIVFAAAMKKWGKTSVEVEQAILDAGERVSNQLRRHLRMLNGISQVSPLFGLLGTVVGMILSFNAIAGAGGDNQREMMAAGIAQALIATAAGMGVAIPALLAYLFFLGRVDQLITEIDGLGQQIVELIAADSSENRNRRAKAA